MATDEFPAALYDLITAFRKSKIIFATSELGIFDDFYNNGPSTSASLASRLKYNPDATRRLLNACVGIGILKKQQEGNIDLYSNTELTNQYLIKDAPFSLHGFLLLNSHIIYPLFDKLADGVKSGTNQIENALGVQAGKMFDTEQGYYSSPEKQLDFMKAMHSLSTISGRYVPSAFDLSKYKTACDLGGATGALAYCLAEKYPNLNITVIDIPSVIIQANYFMKKETYNVTFTAVDFFKEDLPPAELYCMSQIIHDWSEEKVDILIKKVYNALPKGGALLVVECLLNESEDGPIIALLSDLNMLVGTEGRERKSSEYKNILEKHNFVNIQTKYLSSVFDAILAHKN